MTLKIDLNPQEEAWLAAQSAQQGVAPKDVIKRMIDERLTAGTAAPKSGVYENVGQRGGRNTNSSRRVSSRANEPAADTTPLNAEQSAAIALLNSYLETESTDDPEEIRKAELELEEFKRNMNANRAATGERPVYP
jgi:hypothetical protein